MALNEIRPGFRPEIQGLRALAVLLVVAYHCDLGLGGGFTGVDVFFVVSGLVISNLLFDEIDRTGRIGFGGFYARRARRLLPAFAVFVVVVAIASILLLNPGGSLNTVLETGASACVFGANAFLYRTTGYFTARSQLNPFLHTWSLSVEEQFYLVFPLVLLAALRWRRRFVAVIGVLAALSFALSLALTEEWIHLGLQAPARAAFLSSPTRAWEFCIGVLAAIAIRRGRTLPPAVAEGLGAIGFAAIAAAALLIDQAAPFTPIVALVPVLGTAMLAVSTAGPRATLVGRGLSVTPLVALGNLSYAWYLWHWPAIVFAKTIWPDGAFVAPIAAVVSLVPAWISTRFIEARFRAKSDLVGTRAVRLALICTLVPLLLCAGMAMLTDRTALGFYEPNGWYDYPIGVQTGCTLFNHDIANTWIDEPCRTHVPGSRGTILILGDQQADSASSGVIDAATRLGYDTALWDRTGCPLNAHTPVWSPRCEEFNREALALVDRLHPKAVVIANRSAAYTTDAKPDEQIAMADGSRPADVTAALLSWRTGLGTLLDELHQRNTAVIVMATVPQYGSSFPRDHISIARPTIQIPVLRRSDVERERRAVMAAERRAVRGRSDVRFVDPVPVLCTTVCRPEHRGTWYYFDDQHLTRTGGELLSGLFARTITDLLPTATP